MTPSVLRTTKISKFVIGFSCAKVHLCKWIVRVILGDFFVNMIFIFLLILLVAAVYLYIRHVYSYWSRHGYPFLEPSIPVGSLNKVARREQCFGENLFELYKQSTEPFVGIYMMFRPALLVRDPSLVHQMLTTDFASFHDRGVYCNPPDDPMSDNLFSIVAHFYYEETKINATNYDR